jgi:hypothetical protein
MMLVCSNSLHQRIFIIIIIIIIIIASSDSAINAKLIRKGVGTSDSGIF